MNGLMRELEAYEAILSRIFDLILSVESELRESSQVIRSAQQRVARQLGTTLDTTADAERSRAAIGKSLKRLQASREIIAGAWCHKEK